MSRANPIPVAHIPSPRFIHDATDAEVLEQLDELVADATTGEGRAIGAIAIAFGPTLLEEIGAELGAKHRQDESARCAPSLSTTGASAAPTGGKRGRRPADFARSTSRHRQRKEIP